MRLLRGSLTLLSATSEAGRRLTGVWGLAAHRQGSQQQFLRATSADWVATTRWVVTAHPPCVDGVSRPVVPALAEVARTAGQHALPGTMLTPRYGIVPVL